MKKQLLKESEVRKLMKFANIGALTDGFVSRLAEADMMGSEEEEDAGAGMTSPDAPMSMDADAEPEPEQSLEDPDMLDDDMPEEGAAGEVAPAVADFVKEMDIFLNKVAGTPLGTVTSDQGGEDMAAADMPEEDPVDVASAEEPPVEDDTEEEEVPSAVTEAAHEEDEKEDEKEAVDEDMVNEVARRVARRLKNLKNK